MGLERFVALVARIGRLGGKRVRATARSDPAAFRARAFAFVLILSLLAPAGASALTYAPSDDESLQRGTIERQPNGTTVVSTQGFSFKEHRNNKKPSRLVGLQPSGSVKWIHQNPRLKGAWFYDVDPLSNGNLLVVSPRGEQTTVYELNPETNEQVWVERLPYKDTHDIDRLGPNRLVIANMRAWNESRGVSNDRVLIYNRTNDSVVWEWTFREHYPNSTDGGMSKDWTHVNDVDVIDDHRLLLSPRNFDQVVVLNRTTGTIENRLGRDGNHSILHEQHNPDYLVGENGTPTMLVADSENDRVVEYAYLNGSWTRTWTVGSKTLNWPRDADRLPNGNTLITDTLNHRVIEVTPRGKIVWEYYITWGPYDAERIAHGGSSNGPTIREQNATGTYRITGSAGLRAGTGAKLTFHERLQVTFAGTPLEGPASYLAMKWSHVVPWIRPVWMSSWDAAAVAAAGLVALLWGASETYLRRRRLARVVRRVR